MPDGGETNIKRVLGKDVYVDAKTNEPTGEVVGESRKKEETQDSTIPHTDTSIVQDNGEANVVAGATAVPVRRQAELREWKPNLRERMHGGIMDGLMKLGTNKHTARFYADRIAGRTHTGGPALADFFPPTGVPIAANEAKGAYDRGDYTGAALNAAGVVPIPAAKGVSFVKKVKPKPKPKPKTETVPAGEPVSVANGEYLETWTDFLIPGTLPFDGARYMGLKLPQPKRYVSPLGPCQISMFDEVFSNPERGKLLFHDAEGKAIEFDRPFNFLPSENPGYPHLELKAPWLKQLRLKDRNIIKHFSQYPDKVYRLDLIEDLNGNQLAFDRNDDGVLNRIDGPDGLALTFENDAKGRRKSITLIGTDGSELPLARYAYDDKGRMVSADCDFGMSVRYYWQKGDLLSHWHNVTKASETHFTYDEDGRVVHTATNGIWNDDRFVYGEGETSYLPGGSKQSAQRFKYDENENITAEIDPLGGETNHTYNGQGFRTATTDPNGNASSTSYDIWGNVKTFTDAEGRGTTYGWGDNGELHIVIDGAGNRKTYKHDDKSNVVTEIDSEGNATSLVRDDKGRVIKTELPNGAIEKREWDDHNRLIAVTDAKGHITRFDYDTFNRLIISTDALGHVTKRDYEAGAGGFDTASTITRPDGVSVSRSFDAQGQMASVRDGEGRTWRYRHGAFGVLEEITDPKGGKLSFAYDIEGRITCVTNALGRNYHFRRDAAGRAVEEEDFDGRVKRYKRDAAGQVIETIKPDGARLSYDYDKTGLLKRIETFDAEGQAEDTTRFWYDGRGLLVQAENKASLVEFERDKNGRIVGETLNGARIKSMRDSLGNRIVRDMAQAGGGLAEYARDPLGAVEKLSLDETNFSFAHDALGRQTQRRAKGAFAVNQAFDAVGQLTGQSTGSAKRIYEYDKAFAPTKIDDTLWGETTLAYDGNGQLASAKGASGSESFTYDAARNVAGASSAATRAGYGGESYRPTDLNAWQSTPGGVVKVARGPRGERIRLTHDDCGRLIERHVERDGFRAQKWNYSWDVHDRLVGCAFIGADSCLETWVFAYDPFGRRISKVKKQTAKSTTNGKGAPAVGTVFQWDGDQMVAEAPLHLDGQVAWEQATRWIYADETGHTPIAKQLPPAGEDEAGDILHIVSDHLGTPKEMFDEQGALVWAADYHVWGAVRSVRTQGSLALKPSHDPQPAEHHCPFRFPGQYEDAETGLYYNRHRHYDPLTGQYASPDPIGLAGGDRPQGYVDNPGVWTDPLGLSARANYQRPSPTASANWDTARSNYWKNAAANARASGSAKYSPANLERMAEGKAPRMTIIVRNRKTGRISEKDVPVELHHRSLHQRGGSARANESWNLVEASPTAHAGMDPFRHTGYDLIKVIRGPNSWQ